MHCPTCGQPANTGQLYCRQCGMNLLMVGQLVSQHAGKAQQQISRRKSEEDILRCMFTWIWWGMTVLGLGVLMLVTGKSLLNMSNFDPSAAAWLKLLSTYVILGGTGMSLFGVLNAMRRGASLSSGRQPSSLEEPVDAKQLPTNPIPEALPSVTERTTQLIPVEVIIKSSAELKS